jgi:hypothetical protein
MRGKDTLNLGLAHSVVLPLVSLLGQMFQLIRQGVEGLKGSNKQTRKPTIKPTNQQTSD